MQEIQVNSRIIKSVFFSQEDGQLRIAFKNGEQRRFTGVEEDVVAAMCSATSPGQFYIDHVRARYKRLAA